MPAPTVLNNLSTFLGFAYTSGSGSIVLMAGYGATILSKLAAEGQPAISATNPLWITVGTSGTANFIFSATALATDTLTGTVVGGTDQNFLAGLQGAVVEARWTSGLARLYQGPGMGAQSANTSFSGPASGAAAVPAFRALVAADLPATAVTPGTYTIASVVVDATGRITSAASGSAGMGSVTSVALAVPGVVFAVSGSPIATSGTLAISLLTQAANTVFLGPASGAAAVPTFRALAAADVPDVSSIYVTTGTAQTISGIKAFSSQVNLSGVNGQINFGTNGVRLYQQSGLQIDVPNGGNIGIGGRPADSTTAVSLILYCTDVLATTGAKIASFRNGPILANEKVYIGSDGSIGLQGWVKNTQGRGRLTADATNATATMTPVTDLAITLVGARKYFGQVTLFASNSTAAEGLAIDFNGGSATMTSFRAGFIGQPPGVTLGVLTSTTLSTALTATTATTADAVYTIQFCLVCNAGGTFIVRFAEASAHTTGTATVRVSSSVSVEDSPN